MDTGNTLKAYNLPRKNNTVPTFPELVESFNSISEPYKGIFCGVAVFAVLGTIVVAHEAVQKGIVYKRASGTQISINQGNALSA